MNFSLIRAVTLAAVAAGSAAAAQTPPAATPPSGGSAPAAGSTVAPIEPVPTATRAPSGIPADRAYRINPGDEIEIYVWGDERLQRTLRVLPDGSFAFPLVGTVKAEGRTTSDLETELGQRLASQYRNAPPQVTVSVKAPSGLQISVIGKVRGPGSFTPGRYVTLVEALALAGGPADFAAVDGIVIIRSKGGQSQVIRGDVGGILKGKPTSRDLAPGGIPLLQPGDTVVVP
ncbi:polysaccharide biosynthesis/export family protein [Sphingomonas sp. ID0503]|uniref:polysaccharide biosynthesis/export family protein n=1 Tax=Sphingomonas sp. ID0503 TaxID=3399691 RepID=UPI003AFB1379